LRASGDDPEAFGRLYDRHARAVLAFFMRRTGWPQLAADLTAETFAAAFVSRKRYRESRAIDPKRHFWAGTPTAVVVAVVIVYVGGHTLAFVWRGIRDPDEVPRSVLEHDPSPEELAVAEAYDDQWQAAYRAEHRKAAQFADWHAEYEKKHPKKSRRFRLRHDSVPE
jgi:hypothetical protein